MTLYIPYNAFFFLRDDIDTNTDFYHIFSLCITFNSKRSCNTTASSWKKCYCKNISEQFKICKKATYLNNKFMEVRVKLRDLKRNSWNKENATANRKVPFLSVSIHGRWVLNCRDKMSQISITEPLQVETARKIIQTKNMIAVE